jgi:hypothetical protein
VKPTQWKPKHLLWTLYFLKQYPIEDEVARRCKTSIPTFRKYFLIVLEDLLIKLRHFINPKARESFRAPGLFQNISLIVDSSEFPVQRPVDAKLQTDLYSGKKKKNSTENLSQPFSKN